MSGIKEVVKDGWHPKGKEGGKESWRGDFKGINQVAGWVGKGKGNDTVDASTRTPSRPLNSLKDPSTFGAPPRRGETTGSQGITDRGRTQSSLGSGQSQYQSGTHEEETQAEPRKPPPPPVPYRADRTGLATNHLPKPPARHMDQSADDQMAATKPKPKPSVPPRLPARAPSNPNLSDSSHPPPAYDAVARDPPSHAPASSHQGAISRLGKAGVSVPGLGIGEKTNRDNGASQDPSPSTQSPNGRSQVNELQNRFKKMSPSSPNNNSATTTPTEGTTTAQKQDALRTARTFHQDPSSVSSTDARNTASTASNFRERHSEQIATGKEHMATGRKKLSGLNEKYGISKRINGFMGDGDQSSSADQPAAGGNRPPPPVPPSHPNSANEDQYSPVDQPSARNRRPPPVPPPHPNSSSHTAAPLNNRKPPPPPPPPKKQALQSTPVGGEQGAAPPPPLPLGTKPRPGG